MDRAREIPTCPRCGAPQCRVIVDALVHLSPDDKQEVESGRAIFAGDNAPGMPEFVCLTCVPQWGEVNRMASLDFDWQIAKEAAIMAQDFYAAAALRDKQHEIRGQLKLLVAGVLSQTQ